MRKIIDSVLWLAAIIFCSIAITLGVYGIAHADVCAGESPPGDTVVTLNAGQGLSGYAGDYASIFLPSLDCNLDSIDLDFRIDAGAPTDDISVELWSVVGGVPTALLESGTDLDPTGFTGSFTTQTSTFSGTTFMSSTDQYAIVVHRDGFVVSFGVSRKIYLAPDTGWEKGSSSVSYIRAQKKKRANEVHVDLLVCGYWDLLIVLRQTDQLSLLTTLQSTSHLQCRIYGSVVKGAIVLHGMLCGQCNSHLQRSLMRT